MKIDVLTGKRGGYDAMRPMISEAIASEHTVRIIACRMHTVEQFGRTINTIYEDFHPKATIREIPWFEGLSTESNLGWITNSIGNLWTTSGRPDILILFGDRSECLSAAQTAILYQVPIAHIQGGDITGTQDDIVRHMLTKAANFHFCSIPESFFYIKEELGEYECRSFIVGDLHIDALQPIPDIPQDQREGILVLYHPDCDTPQEDEATMRMVLQACYQFNEPTTVIYPCDDPGWAEIVKTAKLSKWCKVVPNLPHRGFVELMAHSTVMVGNSSAGIIEAPYLNLPFVEIGNRQRGRIRSNNVIQPEMLTSQSIFEAMNTKPHPYALPFDQIYGDGTAGKQIIEILSTADKWLFEPKRS